MPLHMSQARRPEKRTDLPGKKGTASSAQAVWWPVEQLEELRDRLFEDHYFILKYFLTLKQP